MDNTTVCENPVCTNPAFGRAKFCSPNCRVNTWKRRSRVKRQPTTNGHAKPKVIGKKLHLTPNQEMYIMFNRGYDVGEVYRDLFRKITRAVGKEFEELEKIYPDLTNLVIIMRTDHQLFEHYKKLT